MGKMRMGILDGFVGKVGTVVGSFWKGKKVIRAYNEFPKQSNTDLQELQRAKLGTLGEMGGALLAALQLGLKEHAAGQVSTEVGEFVKLNMKNVSGSVHHLEVAYDKLILSKGNLTEVALGEANFATPLTVSVPIDDSYYDQRENSEDDIVYLVVYSKTNGKAMMSDGTTKRSEDHVSVSVPGYWQGHYVEVFAFVKSAAKSDDPYNCSPTIYCGNGRIA